MGEPRHRHLSYTYEHVRGHCVVHLGRRRHGADDIASGERMNLIVWNHNLAHRASRAYSDLQQQKVYQREAAAPDAVCLSYTHDRDYLQYKAAPAQVVLPPLPALSSRTTSASISLLSSLLSLASISSHFLPFPHPLHDPISSSSLLAAQEDDAARVVPQHGQMAVLVAPYLDTRGS